MPLATPSINVRFLMSLADQVVPSGTDAAVLLTRLGVEPPGSPAARAFVPLDLAGRLLDLAEELRQDPAIGVRAGALAPAGISGLLGHIMVSSPTVRSMLQAACDYTAVSVRGIDVMFVEIEGCGKLAWTFPPSYAGPQAHFAGFMMAALVTRIRQIAGTAWEPLGVHFEHRQPRDLETYHRVLGKRVRFGQSENAVLIDPTTLALPLPVLAAGLHESMRDLGDRVRAELAADRDLAPAGDDISASVQGLITDDMRRGDQPSLERVARRLGRSARAVQYRLERSETSFERLLDDTRRQHAERFLRDTDLALTEIAARLGFSELSAFTRAAGRWFGMPPSAFRQRCRVKASRAV
jgi:AraC-like DNA-binding protein